MFKFHLILKEKKKKSTHVDFFLLIFSDFFPGFQGFLFTIPNFWVAEQPSIK